MLCISIKYFDFHFLLLIILSKDEVLKPIFTVTKDSKTSMFAVTVRVMFSPSLKRMFYFWFPDYLYVHDDSEVWKHILPNSIFQCPRGGWLDKSIFIPNETSLWPSSSWSRRNSEDGRNARIKGGIQFSVTPHKTPAVIRFMAWTYALEVHASVHSRSFYCRIRL